MSLGLATKGVLGRTIGLATKGILVASSGEVVLLDKGLIPAIRYASLPVPSLFVSLAGASANLSDLHETQKQTSSLVDTKISSREATQKTSGAPKTGSGVQISLSPILKRR